MGGSVGGRGREGKFRDGQHSCGSGHDFGGGLPAESDEDLLQSSPPAHPLDQAGESVHSQMGGLEVNGGHNVQRSEGFRGKAAVEQMGRAVREQDESFWEVEGVEGMLVSLGYIKMGLE